MIVRNVRLSNVCVVFVVDAMEFEIVDFDMLESKISGISSIPQSMSL